MLKSLKLQNFQKHRSFSHDFSEELTVCCGQNWSGKSSLLRGILYALFGTSAVPVKAGNLATRGEKSFLVELQFEVGDQSYKIERGKTKAVLYKDGQILASGQTQVTAAVEQAIGVSARNFLSFNTAQQDEAGALLSLGAQKLGQHLADITGVTLVDDVIEKARAKAALIKDVKQLLDVRLSELEGCEANLADISSQLDGAGAAMQKAISSLETAEFQKQQAAQSANRLRAQADAYQRFMRQYEALRKAVADAEDRVSEAKGRLFEPAVSEQEAKDTYLSLLSQDRDHQQHTKELSSTKAAWEQALKTLESLSAEISSLSSEKPDLVTSQTAYEAAKADFDHLSSSLWAAQESVTKAVCQTCKRPFDEQHLAQAKQEIESLSPKVDEAGSLLKVRKADYESVSATLNRLAELQQLHQQWQTYEIGQASDYRRLMGRDCPPVPSEALQAALSGYENASATHARAKAAKDAYEREAAFLTKSRHELQGLTPAAAVSEDDLSNAQAELTRAFETFSQAGIVCSEAQQAYNNLVAQQGRESDLISGLRTQIASLKGSHGRYLKLTELIKYLKDNRDRFLGQTWQSLLGYASEFVSEATSGDITGIARSDAGEFVYLEGDHAMPVELASGMQRAILGVAVKLAMSSALGGSFSVLLLDEISAAASDENSLILTELLSRTGQQVFLVTHRQADAAVAQAVLELT